MIDEKKLIEELESLRVTVTGIPMNKQLKQYSKHFKDSVIKAIDEQPKVGEWISVKDRLPENEQEVLVITSRGTITTAMHEDGTIDYEDSNWNWYDIDFDYDEENDKYLVPESWWEYKHFNCDDVYNNEIDEDVIAWMSLPEPYRVDIE